MVKVRCELVAESRRQPERWIKSLPRKPPKKPPKSLARAAQGQVILKASGAFFPLPLAQVKTQTQKILSAGRCRQSTLAGPAIQSWRHDDGLQPELGRWRRLACPLSRAKYVEMT
jgi:hypothetical protein